MSKIICHCVQVSDEEIRQAMRDGDKSLQSLKKKLQVASTCNMCIPEIIEIAKEEGVKKDEFYKEI